MLLESPVTINVDENGITVANSPVGKVTCEKTDNNIYNFPLKKRRAKISPPDI